MEVSITIVPPGGGEADYSQVVNLSAIPRVGEYILLRSDDGSRGAFRVLYVTYLLDADHGAAGKFTLSNAGIEIQVEPVKYPTGGDPKFGGDYYFNNPRWSGKVAEYPDSGY